MSAEDRRAALVDTTLPLLRERGRTVSTKEIAAAAGVAEGTIFRVFDSKDDLFDACIHRTFDTSHTRAALHRIDPSLPLAERLAEAVGIMQDRLREIFALFFMLQTTGRPLGRHDAKADHVARQRSSEEVDEDFKAIIGADAALLRVEPQRLIDSLRMLTLSSVHPFMGGKDLKPAELVDIVLEGALAHPNRPTQTRPTQTRPTQTRPTQTRPTKTTRGK
jgi:AcrR family transcriptional regulator